MEPVLASTLFLTLLLIVGLFFFIRASTKDRTETVDFSTPIATVSLLEQLQTYFESRSYEVANLNPDKSEIVFSGVVRASKVLAIFLSALAAVGLGCIALVLYTLSPNLQPAILSSLLLSPLAGWFYWQGANRSETVKVTIRTEKQTGDSSGNSRTHIRVCAHRDEIAVLKAKMNLEQSNATA